MVRIPLWSEFTKNRSPETRNRIVEHYWPWAQTQAARYHKRTPPIVMQEDLEGAAAIGLCQAVDSYDPQQNTKFEGFAYWRVQGAMQDFLRRSDWISRQGRCQANREGRPSGIAIQVLSQQRRFSNGDDTEYQFESTSGSTEPTLDEVAKNDSKTFVLTQLPLSGRELDILELRYWCDMHFWQIGAHLGISESRVSQIHHLLLRRLRSSSRAIQGLRDQLS